VKRLATTSRARGEFTEAMQVTESEEEAHGLLKRHLERSIPGSAVVILNRNNSADRERRGHRVGLGDRR
jgi:hypothetical protein